LVEWEEVSKERVRRLARKWDSPPECRLGGERGKKGDGATSKNPRREEQRMTIYHIWRGEKLLIVEKGEFTR